jgi:hypothetical protein
MGDRSPRQCRERYTNYLSPTIRTDPWTDEEDALLLEKINDLGHAWSAIARSSNRRSSSDVKNRWFSQLRFHVRLDPATNSYVRTDAEFPARKRRRTLKPPPQQRAIQSLSERQNCPEAPPCSKAIAEPIVDKDVFSGSFDESYGNVSDVWDRSFLDEFPNFDYACPSSQFTYL